MTIWVHDLLGIFMFQIPKVSYHSSIDLTQAPQESVSLLHLVPRDLTL